MSGLSPALAQQLQTTITAWNANQAQFSDWLGGVVGGGPNHDGRYPLTNALGVETLVFCPAAIVDEVAGPAAQAEIAKLAAAASAGASASSATAADASKVLAEAAKSAAITARVQAQTAQSNAANHEANARYWAELAQGHGADVETALETVTELAQQSAADAVAAEASAGSAATSAELAAHFEPANFDLKSDPIAANRISGTLSLANLPVLPGPAHYASSGGFANLTTAQQSAIKGGDFVTVTDGRRFVYRGEGSKTAETSYIKIADDTPAWTEIADKPTTFLPSAHSHNHTDINGFTWANLGSKPATFAPSAHTHGLTDISGLQSALDGKLNTANPTIFGVTRIEGPAGTDRIITMATGSKSRWSMMAQAGAENGSNSGSDFWLTNYNDDGSYKGSALEIRRSDNRALFLGGVQAATLTLNTGLIYPNGTDTVVRTGAAGGERYYAFGGDGVFRSLNGGMVASGLVHSNGFVSHSTPTGVYQRFKDNSTATGKAFLQYKDTENFYMMMTNAGDADGGFNGLRPFVVNLTSGLVSMNHGLTVSGDSINVNGGNNANSTLIRRGSLEIRDDNYGPYVDFSTDGTTDFHARVSVPKSDGRLWLSHGAGGSLIVGPTIEANSNNGSQAGSVITHAGSEQIMAKQLTFPSIQNPQDSGANALLEVRGAGGGYGAWMKFHRPGAYGTYFGMFEDGEFGYGGWSAGGTIRKFWTEKNFDPLSRMERYNDGWISTRDGNERFYFATNGRTYMRSRNGFEWRDNSDIWQAILSNDGVFETKNTISTLGNNIKIRGGSPTIYFKDTDNRSAMIHVNANRFYVLRGSGNDSEGWSTVPNKGWPLEIDLETNHATFGGSIYLNSEWYRVHGNTGIYWETWGGGWNMSDANWMRVYGDKNIVTGGQVQMGSFTVTSDRRLKTDITPIPLAQASDIIDRTNVYEFTKGGRRMFGMIAQEAREVAPILVSEGADIHEDGDAILSLDQTGYIPLLLAEVRSLRQRVAQLEGTVH